TLVYYSLGNFVSIQYYNFSMLGGMAQVSITKDASGTYISSYDMDFLVTHYTAGRTAVTTYFLDDYTDELAAQHAILIEPNEKYMNVNKNYPFTVEGLKALARQICPDLAD
ncbi:MAG: CapA family protein, partial [Butyrivibrio sp.]